MRKVGGSFIVTLPKKLVEAEKIKEGEIIDIDIRKVREDGFGVLKGMKPLAVEDELTPSEKVNMATKVRTISIGSSPSATTRCTKLRLQP